MIKEAKKTQRVWHTNLGKGTIVGVPNQFSKLADVKWDDTSISNLVSKESLYPL